MDLEVAIAADLTAVTMMVVVMTADNSEVVVDTAVGQEAVVVPVVVAMMAIIPVVVVVVLVVVHFMMAVDEAHDETTVAELDETVITRSSRNSENPLQVRTYKSILGCLLSSGACELAKVM